MRLVVALGGNALLRRGEPLTVENQRVNVRKAAQALAELGEDITKLHARLSGGESEGKISAGSRRRPGPGHG